MPRFTAVVFDLDGTLLDTLDDLAASVNVALQKNGFPQRSREEVCHFVGNGMAQLIRCAVPEGTSQSEIEQVLAYFKSYYAQHNADKTRPYEGIQHMLEALRQQGIQVAVVSNKNDENTKVLSSSHFGIEVALGDQEGRQRKPAPDGIWQAMSLLGASAESTLYVGDSEVDVQTAQNAGLTCLAVTWGFRSQAELLTAGAVYFAAHPRDVVAFVQHGKKGIAEQA